MLKCLIFAFLFLKSGSRRGNFHYFHTPGAYLFCLFIAYGAIPAMLILFPMHFGF